MNNELSNRILSFEADHVWLHENREKLLEQFSDQWIAVKNQQVVSSETELDRLLAKLPDAAYTCVEFMTREPMEMVL